MHFALRQIVIVKAQSRSICRCKMKLWSDANVSCESLIVIKCAAIVHHCPMNHHPKVSLLPRPQSSQPCRRNECNSKTRLPPYWAPYTRCYRRSHLRQRRPRPPASSRPRNQGHPASTTKTRTLPARGSRRKDVDAEHATAVITHLPNWSASARAPRLRMSESTCVAGTSNEQGQQLEDPRHPGLRTSPNTCSSTTRTGPTCAGT